MSSRHSTRQRLIEAALALFAVQGIRETTTKQIAEQADVNEVTLFRQFGSKHGLMLAVMEESAIFSQMGASLIPPTQLNSDIARTLKHYGFALLQALEQMPEVVRSVIGEAGQYPAENREALGRGLTQVNVDVAAYFESVMGQEALQSPLGATALASVLHSLLLGYAVIELTSEFHHLWRDREEFLDHLVTLFILGAVSPTSPRISTEPVIADLPATLVHTILQRAKRAGLQEYAWVYVLFGAGLSVMELRSLVRSQHISDADQQFLQITQGTVRQVPINQWIMGHRYGSYTKNPLTQWLKSRKDNRTEMFLKDDGTPLSETQLQQRWQDLTHDLMTPEGRPPSITQCQQTWCVEMLMRGIAVEDMMLLSGWDLAKLQPYVQRAKEKTAMEQAIRLDQKA